MKSTPQPCEGDELTVRFMLEEGKSTCAFGSCTTTVGSVTTQRMADGQVGGSARPRMAGPHQAKLTVEQVEGILTFEQGMGVLLWLCVRARGGGADHDCRNCSSMPPRSSVLAATRRVARLRLSAVASAAASLSFLDQDACAGG